MKPESNMNTNIKSHSSWSFVPLCLAVCLLGLTLPGPLAVDAAQPPGLSSSPGLSSEGQTQINTTATEPADAEPTARMSSDELASLVAPIALYPDPILIQVLAASTYPLEVVRLKQWMDKNKKLKGKELADAVSQQNWDPSVQALSAFPTIVDKLANDIEWTTDLGNAFLTQQDDLMDAVQTLRAKAQANGVLKSNDKQTVGTEATNEGALAITIESAQRDVVYVPSYNTQYVYRDSGSSSSSSDSGDSNYSNYSGDSGYSSGSDDGYSYLAYAAGAATGAAAAYYWGNYNWRDGYAEVNYKNYYNQNRNNKNNNWSNNGNNSNNAKNWSNNASNSNSNASNWSNKANYLNGSDRSAQRATQGTGQWQHDPSHRGNAPYGNRDLANRMEQANNRLGGGAGNRASQASGTNGADQLARSSRASQLSRTNPGNQLTRGSSARPAGSGSARPSTRPPNSGAPNRVGNRVPSNWPSTARGGAFGPSNGNLARSFSGRGAQSMGPQSGFRGGPPRGLNAGGPPMGAGFRGGPPGGGFRGGPPGGGFPGGGPPMGGFPGGGPPMGGAPPPPPPGP
jgi:hypothetical protein